MTQFSTDVDTDGSLPSSELSTPTPAPASGIPDAEINSPGSNLSYFDIPSTIAGGEVSSGYGPGYGGFGPAAVRQAANTPQDAPTTEVIPKSKRIDGKPEPTSRSARVASRGTTPMLGRIEKQRTPKGRGRPTALLTPRQKSPTLPAGEDSEMSEPVCSPPRNPINEEQSSSLPYTINSCLPKYRHKVMRFLAQHDDPLSRNNTTKWHDVIRVATEEYRNREREFCITLPESEKKLFQHGAPNQPIIPWALAFGRRTYFQFMLLLKGLIPCVVIYNPGCHSLVTRLVQECLEPVMEKYKLKRFGFHLQQFTHKLPTGKDRGYEHGWILGDERSQEWRDIQTVFLLPYPYGNVASDSQLWKAIRLPCLPGSKSVTYLDVTEAKELGSLGVTGLDYNSVIGFTYSCPDDPPFDDMGYHFMKCFDAACVVGLKIAVYGNESKDFQEYLENQHGHKEALVTDETLEGWWEE